MQFDETGTFVKDNLLTLTEKGEVSYFKGLGGQLGDALNNEKQPIPVALWPMPRS